jgi:hypothetical protein
VSASATSGRERTAPYNAPLFRAGVAQLVEQRIRNAKVGGSIPSTGTKVPGLGFNSRKILLSPAPIEHHCRRGETAFDVFA